MRKTDIDFEILMTAVKRGESLPCAWYTELSSVEADIDQIFFKTWQYVGSLDKLQCDTDSMGITLADVSVVVMRRNQNLIAFANTRGRMGKLHGRCELTPHAKTKSNVRWGNHGLLAIRVEALGPFVFVNLDQEALPLQETYASVLPWIARSGIELNTLQPWSRYQNNGCANWKTVIENYLECYHCSNAHPGFSSVVNTNPHQYTLTVNGLVLSQTGLVQRRISTGDNINTFYDARGRITQAQYHLLWPNTTINISPGFPNLSIGVSYPNGPHNTQGFSDYYFGAGVTHKFARGLIAFDDITNAEDTSLVSSVQRSLIAGLDIPTRVLENAERLVVEFQKLVVRAHTQSFR